MLDKLKSSDHSVEGCKVGLHRRSDGQLSISKKRISVFAVRKEAEKLD